MLGSLLTIFALAFWLPNLTGFDFSQWFTNYQTPSVVATPYPMPTPYVFPTSTPTTLKTPQPTVKPTATPTPKPSITPSPKPSTTPTPRPTASPTPKPSTTPTPTPQSTIAITTSNVLTALNKHRANNGVPSLSLDQKLQDYAQSRANYLKSIGRLDNHAGFNDYIQNQDGFTKLGFNSLAENQSWNYQGTADGLISQFYGSSPGHNQNQLSPNYTHVGIGISGVYTNIVFGGSKR